MLNYPYTRLIFSAFLLTPSLSQAIDSNHITAFPKDRLNANVSYDIMKKQYDIFKLDSKDKNIEYHGNHIAISSDIFNNFRLEGSYWERELEISNNSVDIESWQGAMQYTFFSDADDKLKLAGRINYSQNTGSDTRQTQKVSDSDWFFLLEKPHDSQKSIAFISSYAFDEQLIFNSFIEFGKNKSDYKQYEITTFRNSCRYKLEIDFDRKRYRGYRDLAYTCSPSNGVILEEITGPLPEKDAQKLNRNLNPKNLSYDANFMQLGFSLDWRIKQWELRGGYRFNKQDRKGVDSFVKQHGGVTMDKNHILTGQIMYNFLPYLAGSFTAQYFHNQLLGEIPFLYNGSTSKHFDRHFGLISVGIHAKWK